MAPNVAWDSLLKCDPNTLEREVDVANQIEDIISKVEVSSLKDETSEKLIHLFSLTQSLMKLKSQEAAVAMEEVERAGTDQARVERQYKAKIDKLENELTQVPGRGGRNASLMRGEIQELEQNLERRDQELLAVEQNLEKEKKWSEQLSKKVEEAEGEISKLKRENDILRQDIVDYQRQMDSQRESKRSRTEDGADLKAQISRMKREMMEYLDDIQNLTEANERLVTQAQQLQKELEQSAVDMERMAEEYAQMRVLVQQSDLVVDQLRRDKEHLALQVQELNTLLQVRSEEDDPIMQAVNTKIEEWKSVLVGKDEELLEYQKRVRHLQERLKATQLDSDKQSVVALQQALQVREQQMELLAEQMGQHTAEMERNAAVMEEMRDQLQQQRAAPSSQAFQNATLRGRMAELEGRLRQAEEVARAADADAAEKDRQLIDALARMRQYEAGEYGLAEAVADIKACQQQVRTRDGTVETLTHNLNALEMRLNDMLDENDELRSRLGLESKSVVDLTEIRKNKALTQQRYRAENQVLLKEIERLEEERLMHKKQIRKLAQDRGQRAASIGLQADDLNLSDDLAEDGTTSKKSQSVWTKADMEGLSRKVEQLCQELEHREKELAEKSKEGSSLRHQVSELQAEVSGLEAGLREVSAAVRAAQSAPGGPGGPGVGAGGGGGGTAIHLPSLERLLTVLEARRSGGPHEGVAPLKEQLAQLMGRNQELRDELRATRSEALAASSTKDRAFDKMSRLEGELALLRTSGVTGMALPTLPLPEGMVPSSSDVINALNEYLVQVLQDNSGKDAELERVSESLEQLKCKFAVACHQQSLLYQDFHSEREEWQKERERLQREKASLEEKNQENSIHIQEYNNLLEASKLDGSELNRKLSEMSRRMTVLRVNELSLGRRHAALAEAESHERRENARLHADVTDMEAAVAQRIGYLQRYKDMASYKIAALQKALADSVPASELEVTHRRYNELTAKYRDLLQRDNVLAQRASSVEHVKEENTALRAEVTMVSKELEICKEKLHTLEQANERIAKQGFTTSAVGTGAGDADESVSRRLTVLEMRELNERQRAEHALHMQRHAEEALARAHERNQQLEEKFAQLTRMNLEAQRVEAELRDELAGGVSRAVSEADRRQIRQLEESEAALRMEVSKQRDVAEVARAQAESWASRQHSHEKEVESLRRQLSDLQCRSDEKTLLGTLHQHIMALQLSEATALRKLDTVRAKLSRAEAWGLRLEQQLDQREQTLIHARAEGHSRAGHLRRALQALRHRYAGAVPLAEQERFHRTLAQLQDDEMTAAEEARKCREDRRLAEDRLAELEVKSKGLEELVSTLKDARGAQKVCEWHRRMQELRVSELRMEREAARHRDEASHLRAAVEEHERSRSLLEHEILQLNKFHEESQLAWEQRELELEKQVEAHERQQREMLSAARKFEEVGGTVPDTGLPVAQQLEKAITTIRGHVKTILQSQAQCRSLEEQLQQKQDALHSAEANVLSRERVINELRLRLPASAQREKLLAAAAAAVDGGGSGEGGGALVATQRAVANLQARLDHKEQLVDKYQRQLQQAQQELEELNRQHGEEMKAVHHKLNAQSNATFSKFKQAVLETLNSRPAIATAPANAAQLTRLAELEQTSAEQEEAMVALAERLRVTLADAQRHKVQLLQQLTEHRAETAKLQQLHSAELRAERARAEEARGSEAALAEELRLLRVELNAQKEANVRSPTAGIRSLVERLKGELAYKEKQLKGLSQAMLRLQGEMTNQAEQNIIAAAAQKEESLNVQTLVDKHTKDYKARLESAQAEASAARRELAECRRRERELCERLEAAEREARRGDKEGGRLRAGKEEAERGRDEMRRRIERIQAQLQKGVDGAGRQTQVEELQGRVKRLEQELEKKAAQLEEAQQRAERTAAKEDKAEPKEQVIRWEEGKRWQAKVEALRGKLRDKEKEVETLTKQMAAIRDSIARDAASRRTQDRGVTAGRVLAARAQEEASRAQQLQDTNRQLEDTIAGMRQRAALSKEAAVEELLLQNRRLQEKLRVLERSAKSQKRPSQKPPPRVAVQLPGQLPRADPLRESEAADGIAAAAEAAAAALSTDVDEAPASSSPPEGTAVADSGKSLAGRGSAAVSEARSNGNPEAEREPPGGRVEVGAAAAAAGAAASGETGRGDGGGAGESATPGGRQEEAVMVGGSGDGGSTGVGAPEVAGMQARKPRKGLLRAAAQQDEEEFDDVAAAAAAAPAVIGSGGGEEDRNAEPPAIVGADEAQSEPPAGDASAIAEEARLESPPECAPEGRPAGDPSGTEPGNDLGNREERVDSGQKEGSGGTGDGTRDSNEASETPSSNSRLDTEQEVQRRLLELSDENVELRFELERVRQDLPRLQDKLSDLQALCAQLKREKGEMERKLGNVRGAGRSGKTVPELEKTVGLMQRVVEKLQRENEELRRAPGVVEAQRSAGLEADNAKLKAELQALRLKAGQQLSDRYETRSRGVDKLITENEKLLAHIKREREAVDKLRGEKRSLELALELARQEAESSRRRLGDVEAQLARTQAHDEQGLKPGALSKLYEARLRDAQEETERACRGLEDARALLRQGEQRESEHRRRHRQLEQQVELLKKFPEEAKSQPGLTREFQIARLTIDRLEKEKAELGEELEQLRKNEPSAERDVLQKARRYDELLQENVQVQVQLREMKMHNGRLEEEVRGLRKELESFDPAFFEEIEDLKFNYKEAVKRNLVYEEQLLSLGQQFGITVAVPANVSVD